MEEWMGAAGRGARQVKPVLVSENLCKDTHANKHTSKSRQTGTCRSSFESLISSLHFYTHIRKQMLRREIRNDALCWAQTTGGWKKLGCIKHIGKTFYITFNIIFSNFRHAHTIRFENYGKSLSIDIIKMFMSEGAVSSASPHVISWGSRWKQNRDCGGKTFCNIHSSLQWEK